MIIKTIITFILLFSLDNLIGIFMPRTLWGLYVIVPYSLLIAICLHSFYDDENYLPILAFTFGFLFDIYNANLIGLYATLFPIIVIIIKKYIVPITPFNFVSTFYISVIAIISIEVNLFILVSFAMSQAMTLFRFIQHRLIITLVFNVMMLTIMYWPLVKLFRTKDEKKKKSKLS
jgi:rod shape-determining protein MreD